MTLLTDAECRGATPNGTVQKLRDGNGLYLHVMSTAKFWRYDYRYNNLRRTVTFGTYPDITLKRARLDLGLAKAQLADGIDPNYARQLTQHVSDDMTFKAVAMEFFDIQDWTDGHRHTILNRVHKDLFPKIGDRSVATLRPPDFLAVFRVAESRGAIETAHRLKTVSSQIMRYAVAVGHIDSDPCRDLRGALKTPRAKRYAAIVDPQPFGRLLHAIGLYDNSAVIAHALQLAPHVALRPGELRGAQWSEFDMKNALWEIPAERMKKKRDHLVPLTRQSMAIINAAREYSHGNDLLFPSLKAAGRPISEGALNAALKYLGYPGTVHTPHGFRSSFSTMAYESELFTEDVIEMQLAHLDKNRVKAAYKRGQHLQARRELMAWWSNEIDTMRQKSLSDFQSMR